MTEVAGHSHTDRIDDCRCAPSRSEKQGANVNQETLQTALHTVRIDLIAMHSSQQHGRYSITV